MKPITTNDIMRKFLSSQEILEIENEVNKTIESHRGGARQNAGRKKLVEGKVLKFTKRLTDIEVKFINYARAHNINYEDLMQG